MNDDLRARYLAALRDIAPDLPEGYIDPKADLLDEYDLDSMDLLNLVATLSDQLGVDVPERDYPELRTLATAVPYLEGRLTTAQP